MKKEKLSIIVLALELLVITILHSNKINKVDRADSVAKEKMEQIAPASNHNFVLQVSIK